uniref:Sigma70_r2 domain-containing protein n=1 Tax=Steinernema glaseri TaxID=37863 RepID=A0A1I8ASD5_9BILA
MPQTSAISSKQKADTFGAPFNIPAQTTRLPFGMKAQGQIQQVSKDVVRNQAHRALRDSGKQGIPYFPKSAGGQTYGTIAQQGRHRQHQRGSGQTQRIDYLLQVDRHHHCGDFCQQQTGQGQEHASLESPNLAAQDSQALDVLYDQEAPLMLALGQAVLGRRIDAEEVLRDSFVLLWKNAAGYDPDLGEGRAWIYSILRFRLLARLRQRTQSGDNNYALPAIQPQAGQRFIPALGKLDGTSQRAMIHAYLHGNSYEQLGPQLNRSPAQLRAVVQHGLQQLTPLINEGNANDPRHAVMIGEYTLGLLSQHELAQAHTLMQQNDQAARLALAWEQAWLELVDCLTPTLPAPTSLAHIHHTLGLPPPAARRQAGSTAATTDATSKPESTSPNANAPASKPERQEPSIKTSAPAASTTKVEAATRTEPRWSANSSNDKADDHTPPFPTLLRA